MESSIFVPIMVAAIQSAGQVLSSLASKAKEAAGNYVFSKDFFEETIVDASEQLANFIKLSSLSLKQEIREQSILDVVQELQAHVASIGELLRLVKTSEISPAMADRLITSGLVPLQVSLKKAEIRLSHYGRDDMRLFCHVVGTNTLISGYVYSGQNVPSLERDLEESVHVFQKRLLDAIAQSGREVPWEKVSRLMTIDGISELVELYNSTLQPVKKNSPIENAVNLTKNPDPEPKPPSKVQKRKVKDMDLEKFVGTARKIYDPLYHNTDCSECGHKIVLTNPSHCPNCRRLFV